jgi:transcriptional regulator
MSDEQTHDLLTAVGVGHLVIATPQGLESSFVPFLHERRGEQLVITAHIATANPMRKLIPQAQSALLIVQGPDTYISPSWYPSKAETHRVVPTWNYAIVHLHGSVQLVEDRERLLSIVTNLTREHEADRDRPWAVSDAPAEFIEAQLRAIVGVELIVDQIHAKAKLSQNRSEPDRSAVTTTLLSGDARQQAVGVMMRDRQTH